MLLLLLPSDDVEENGEFPGHKRCGQCSKGIVKLNRRCSADGKRNERVEKTGKMYSLREKT